MKQYITLHYHSTEGVSIDLQVSERNTSYDVVAGINKYLKSGVMCAFYFSDFVFRPSNY
mgnify:CR=1 FL=1